MSPDDNTIFFHYTFRLDDGKVLEHRVTLDARTLEMIGGVPEDPPIWTLLEFSRCDHCTDCPGKYCPVALRLVEPIRTFSAVTSITQADIQVVTQDRTYSKRTDVQTGLGSLFGLIMATSGSRTLARFKPMARFHLPFSSIEETVYRFASMLLLDAHFKKKSAFTLGFGPNEIREFYQPIGEVNRCVFNRLKTAVKADSTLNAVVALDCFAELVPDSFERGLKDLSGYFK